ncbi:MAG: GAF domain-containing protein [Chlamydiae bacterium]|nr:GAF domain-containing protein [Chlamydiota bacterium]MBI3276637.1 GAF domain-containing protein [Chlamydiota bacterium]
MPKKTRELQKLKWLYGINRIITSTQEPRKVLKSLLKETVRMMKATSGSILLIEPKTRFLKVEVAQNISRNKIRSLGLKVGEGVTGWVAKIGRPLLVSDVKREPKYVQVDKKIRSELAVPLVLKAKVIGVINVNSTRQNAFTRMDLELLSNLAAHSAQMIQNVRLFSDTLKQAQKLSSLFNMGQTIISSIEIEEVLNRVTEEAAKLTETKICSLMLLDEKKEELVIRSVYGGSERYIRKPNLPVRQSLLGQVVLKRQDLQVFDVKSSSVYRYPEIAQEEGLCSLLSVPMIFQRKVIGILNVYSSQLRHYSQEEVDVLSALASLAAMAIENARLYGHTIQAEEHLRQQERLAILGEVAAEIAHEIRNPLTVIKMLIQSIQNNTEGSVSPILRKDIEVVGEKIRHMERIVDQALSIGRPGEMFLEQTDLRICLDETLAFLRFRLAQQRIKVETHFAKEVDKVQVDRALISQAFLNIVLNAIQAMPRGGTLTVSIHQVEDKIRIQFQDTGVGIPPEYINKLFQPFFTARRGGTGLGLAIVQRIVESHSGRISVQSEVGEGSTFTFELSSRAA